jgi:hypothetical protein
MSVYYYINTEQKALEINLNHRLYGTFAEIGAGQEVARNFFQAGAASSTIAKTMSAYDKTYSDAIYGVEESGRYVCESRLYKMLDHEWTLLEERLNNIKEDRTFFVFADTVSAINYAKTNKGHGWLGIRFQLSPGAPTNDLVIHVKMTDNDNKLQQDAIGILGVNLIYAAFYFHYDLEKMVRSLHDNVKDRATIDHINLSGPDFLNVDPRLLSFYSVKHGLTEVAIFDENKQNVHASEFLYKKSVMVVRGRFKPTTLVTEDVFKKSFAQFIDEVVDDERKACEVAELTLDHLRNDDGSIDEQDFLDRSELLCALGQKVIISDCSNHHILINYLADYKIMHLGIVIGAHELLELIIEKFDHNQDGRILEALGELFTRNIKIYAYPALQKDNTLLCGSSLPVPNEISNLYRYLVDSGQIVDVKNYNRELLNIYSAKVLKGIQGLVHEQAYDWEKCVPEYLVNIIKEKKLFTYQIQDA